MKKFIMKPKRLVMHALLLSLFLSLSILAGACSGLIPPGDTVTPPKNTHNQSDRDESIMNEFNRLKSKNASPAELMAFIEPKIGSLEKEDADKAVRVLLEVQQLQLANYNDKMMEEDFSLKLNSYSHEDLLALKNIKDEDVKSLLENAYKDGYKLSSAEGTYYLELDFAAMENKFSSFVSEETAAYLDIMADESTRHFAVDAALIISLEDLAGRVINTENFIERYPESSFIKEIRQRHQYYLTAYLAGLDNTPAFSYEDNVLKPKVLESFKDSMQRYKGSKLAGLLDKYVDLLEKNDYKRTQEVVSFINNAK